MSAIVETIHALVAPVVMISANGLVCLALYNRLAAVVGRLRVFSREFFDIHIRLAGLAPQDREGVLARELQMRLGDLNAQYSGIIRRARLLRNALIILLTAVIAMLICSLVLGLSLAVPEMEGWSLIPFFIGVLAMIAGTSLAIRELACALEPVKAERNALRKM